MFLVPIDFENAEHKYLTFRRANKGLKQNLYLLLAVIFEEMKMFKKADFLVRI